MVRDGMRDTKRKASGLLIFQPGTTIYPPRTPYEIRYKRSCQAGQDALMR